MAGSPDECPWVVMGPPPAVGSCTKCLRALAGPAAPHSPRQYAQRLRRFIQQHRGCGRLPDRVVLEGVVVTYTMEPFERNSP